MIKEEEARNVLFFSVTVWNAAYCSININTSTVNQPKLQGAPCVKVLYFLVAYYSIFLVCCIIHIYFHWHECCSLSAGASVLVRSSLKPGPSLVTSAITSAWLWRNLLKSTRCCTEWLPLICICLTLWLTEPINLSWPWRWTDIHLQVRWGGMSLIDWQTVTEPLGHCKTMSAQQESNIMLVHKCVLVCGHWCFCMSVCVCVCGCVCQCGWSALYRLPIAPWVLWQVRNQACRLTQTTSSRTGRI